MPQRLTPGMLANPSNSAQAPQFSVLITVYDDWEALAGCLEALAAQVAAPPFEVIVIDDGSREPAPDAVRKWKNSYPLQIVTEKHAGIAAARNRGVAESKGAILLFTDADCRLAPDCLSELANAIDNAPAHNSFQLHLAGDYSTLLGRAEELRLIALQDQTLQPDGRIRLLNTAGFAIRRSHKVIPKGPFDPTALRGEDTLLLATLMQEDELPRFVPRATVRHALSMSLIEGLSKDIHSGWLEGGTFKTIDTMGIQIRMRNRDRARMLYSTWKISRERSIGQLAWAVLVMRQSFERTVTTIYRYLPHK